MRFLPGLIVALLMAGEVAAQSTQPIVIQYYYFEGCPAWRVSWRNLKQAVLEMGIQADLKVVKLEAEEQVTTERFLGSPTIRINGNEIEGDESGKEYTMACRAFTEDGKLTETPSAAFFKEKLKAMLASKE